MSKALEEALGFRIKGANVEHLVNHDGIMVEKGARPATGQEKLMWQMLLDQENLVADEQVKAGRYKAQVDALNTKVEGLRSDISKMRLTSTENGANRR